MTTPKTPTTEAGKRMLNEWPALLTANQRRERDAMARGLAEVEAQATQEAVVRLSDVVKEHRECGKPKFDGCFSHPPGPHCRSDGNPWPCDVDQIRSLLTGTTDTGKHQSVGEYLDSIGLSVNLTEQTVELLGNTDTGKEEG